MSYGGRAFHSARVSEARAKHVPYYGPMFADSLAGRRLALLGQVSPIVRARMQMQHGRFLSGFGNEQPSGEVGDDPAYQSMAPYKLEMQDDVYGSGIFDPGGRAGTSNTNMGVFASHYSLPGYIAREVPFTVSRDVTDITDDAEVVYVPGGGMVYVEQRGKLTRPAVLGPTWVPPRIQPAGVSGREQVYAFMTFPGQAPPTPLNPHAPRLPPPSYNPPRTSRNWVAIPPAVPPQCAVPRAPQQWVLPRQNIITPDRPQIAVRFPPPCPPMSGFGEEEKKPASKAQLAVAGAIAGAAVGLIVHIVRKKR